MALEAGQAEAAPNTDQPTAPAATSGTVDAPSALSTFDYDAIKTGFHKVVAPEATATVKAEAPSTEEPAPATEQQPATPEAPAPAEEDRELPDKIRVRLSDPEDIGIAAIMRKENCSFAKAARLYFNRNQPAATIPGTEAQAPAADTEPTAVQKIQGEINTLTAQLAKDRENSDQLSDESLDRRDRLTELRADLKLAQRDEAQTQRERQQDQENQQQATTAHAQANSHAEMVGKYPALKDRGSEFFKACQAVTDEWKANSDLIKHLQGPDAPLLVVKEAIFRNPQIGVTAPLKPASPAPVVPAMPAPAPRRVNPAPGSAAQGDPTQTFNPAAVVKDVGFDPAKAKEALYGNPKASAALIG